MAYTATATATAGRSGRVISSDGAIDLPTALPGSGKPGTTNPEQLFAAGYAACFGSALLAVSGGKVKPDQVAITADVTLNINGHDYSISVVLNVKLDGVDHATAEQLAHTAHQVCPYSKATRNNIPVEIRIL